MLVVCTPTFGHSFKAATTVCVCTAKMMRSTAPKQLVTQLGQLGIHVSMDFTANVSCFAHGLGHAWLLRWRVLRVGDRD